MELSKTDISTILKGIRFLFGYTQKQLAKQINVSQSTINRWELRKVARPSLRNINKIQNFLVDNNLNIYELLKIGETKLKSLITNILDQLNISHNECAKLLGINPATLSYILRDKIKPTPFTIKKILTRCKEIKLSDKRRLLFDLYKQSRNRANSRILKLAENYPKIIGFKQENNCGKTFETKIAKIFEGYGFTVFRNPVLADENLRMRYCTDIYAVKNDIEICVECKKLSSTQLRNRLGEFLTQLSALKEIVPHVVMCVNGVLTDKRKSLGRHKGILLIDTNDIKSMRKDSKRLFNLLRIQKSPSQLPSQINSGEDIILLRKFYNLSISQLACLVGYSSTEIFRVEKGLRKLTNKLKHKLEKLMEQIKTSDIRKIHFLINKKRALKKRPEVAYKFDEAENLEKVINFRNYNYSGRSLENKISKILSGIGYKTIENVVLANNDVSETYEVDVYAVKDDCEVLIEIKNKLHSQRLSDTIRELRHKSKVLNINKVAIVVDSKFSGNMRKFKNNGILVFTNDSTLQENLTNSFS